MPSLVKVAPHEIRQRILKQALKDQSVTIRTVAPHEIRQRILKPYLVWLVCGCCQVAPHEIRQRILKHGRRPSVPAGYFCCTTRDSSENTETAIARHMAQMRQRVAPHEIRQRILKRLLSVAFSMENNVAPHEIRQRILKQRDR